MVQIWQRIMVAENLSLASHFRGFGLHALFSSADQLNYFSKIQSSPGLGGVSGKSCSCAFRFLLGVFLAKTDIIVG